MPKDQDDACPPDEERLRGQSRAVLLEHLESGDLDLWDITAGDGLEPQDFDWLSSPPSPQ